VTTSRETIAAGLLSALWGIDGVAIVTRNLRRMFTIDQFPAIFIADLGDNVVRHLRSDPPENERSWTIGVASILQATSEESAPDEMDAHQDMVKAALYSACRELRVGIRETQTEPLSFPDIGNNVVAQGVQFDIAYVDRVETDT
jgi:hypothetical protein